MHWFERHQYEYMWHLSTQCISFSQLRHVAGTWVC